jgi:hypothetical protein
MGHKHTDQAGAGAESHREVFADADKMRKLDRLYHGDHERRLVGRVLRHWTKTVHARGFPRHEEIDPWMLGDDWENCLLSAFALI